jgi:hypothetical protein
MPKPSCARLLKTEPSRTKQEVGKKLYATHADIWWHYARYLTMMDPMVPFRMQHCVMRGETSRGCSE